MVSFADSMTYVDWHFGGFLRSTVEKSGKKKKDVARSIGVEAVTLGTWFRQAAPNMKPENRVGLCRVLGISEQEVARRLDTARRGVRDGAGKIIEHRGSTLQAAMDRDQDVVEIPLIQLSLAAGGWTDVSELSEPGELDAAVFMVHLAGDSMLPIYPEGVVVLFRRLCLDRESPVPTRDYYVQRSDGLATFKMIEKAGETEYVLRALNRRKYGQPLSVEKSLVVHVAAAVGKVELI